MGVLSSPLPCYVIPLNLEVAAWADAFIKSNISVCKGSGFFFLHRHF